MVKVSQIFFGVFLGCDNITFFFFIEIFCRSCDRFLDFKDLIALYHNFEAFCIVCFKNFE